MANRKIDLTGLQFGRWTVLRESVERRVQGQPEWICQCECGTTRSVVGANLRNGVSNSCGCLSTAALAKHGVSGDKPGTAVEIGRQFGLWTVVAPATSTGGSVTALCRCQCGTERRVLARNLVRGRSTSCGCDRIAKSVRARTTHGMTGHPIYTCWVRMIDRCENEKSPDFKWYGARGIKVCGRWHEFDAFRSDVEPSWRRGLTIERLDVNGDYKPLNVRWATQAEQTRNKTTSVLVETPWGKMTVAEAARKVGVSRKAFEMRLLRGWAPMDLYSSNKFRRGSR